eukprot:TRINITY_DN31272_c0_g1_i1.p1 TRINITY_DN31272_c0_g1~~TRINITY_DN31272_c0_g1_i1.p1  ORF type:complete len:690 (+),score=164.31 TRINITY_DN31272_c0_g1_i1:274-2070(+)
MEDWRAAWQPLGAGSEYICSPTFIHKLSSGPNVTLAASCRFAMEQLQAFPADGGSDVGKYSHRVPVTPGGIFSVGAADPFTAEGEAESIYLGGVGVTAKVNAVTAERAWETVLPASDGTCSSPRFAQALAASARQGLISVGFCGDNRDSVLYIDRMDNSSGAILETYGFNVSWWKWTGVGTHRAALAVYDDVEAEETHLYLAGQSELADAGWLVRLNWSSAGLDTATPLWNISLAWPRPSEGDPIPLRIELGLVQSGNTQNRTALLLLANSALFLLNPASGAAANNPFPIEVSREWGMAVLPASGVIASASDVGRAWGSDPAFAVDVVVAYNSRTVHPLERIFLAFFAVFEDSLQLVHLSEIDTAVDMEVRSVAAGPYSPGSPTQGVWVAASETCSGANPCLPDNPFNDTSVVVNFNLSDVGKGCSACLPGWAGPNCTRQCPCVRGGGSSGACYDGPFHDGSCRCDTRTYSTACFPCICSEKHGVCDSGVNGTGMCVSCVSEAGSSPTYYGQDCDHRCNCTQDEQCDSGVFGSGRCTPAPSPPSPSSGGWSRNATYGVVAGCVAVLLAAAAAAAFAFKRKKASRATPATLNSTYGAVE